MFFLSLLFDVEGQLGPQERMVFGSLKCIGIHHDKEQSLRMLSYSLIDALIAEYPCAGS